MIKDCFICKREFSTTKEHILCCSNICRGQKRSANNVLVKCTICHINYTIKPNRVEKSKYCSRPCKDKGMIGHRPFNYNGGRLVHKGYVYILTKDHPNSDRDGYVSEHRLVMERHLGRILDKEEVVHHKDRNRSNNSIDNLELKKSQSEHMQEHYPKGTHIYKDIHPWLGKKHKKESRVKMSVSRRKRFQKLCESF